MLSSKKNTKGIAFNEYVGRPPTQIDDAATMQEVYELNPYFCPIPSKLSAQESQTKELKGLIKENKFIYCYDGFEPSGRMHIAQGLMKAANVNKLVEAGCIFIFWVADWFGLLNDKMGGDLDKIKVVGQYFIEVWKAAGMKMSNVKFLWASNHINRHSQDYWLSVIDIARKNTTTRIQHCTQIMGKSEDAELSCAQLMYPCMQATDVFYLKTDICQLGLDQRKVNMLAREYVDKNKKIEKKPVILSSVMIPGLLKGQYKMSKSNPESAIFMEDAAEDVARKIKNAYAPPNDLKENPVVDFARHFIFKIYGQILIERSPQNGGAVHPADLKVSVTKGLNQALDPVRRHFKENTSAKKLLATIKYYQEQAKK